MAIHPYLEIEIHLCSGKTHRFVQNDPALAQQTLQQVSPKVFTRPSLVISGHHQSAAYAGATLIGIRLHMETVPIALLNSGTLPTLPLEITEKDYHARQNEMLSAPARQLLLSVCEIEFTCGYRLWIEVMVPQPASEMQERRFLHNIFSMPGLMCRRLGGGISLWNGAQMASCSFTPELDAPSNAWVAEFAHGS